MLNARQQRAAEKRHHLLYWYDTVYLTNYYCFFGVKDDRPYDYMRDKMIGDLVMDGDGFAFNPHCNARSSIYFGKKSTFSILMFQDETPCPEVIAHEVFHAATFIWNDRQLEYTPHNESMAYYIGSIVKMITDHCYEQITGRW